MFNLNEIEIKDNLVLAKPVGVIGGGVVKEGTHFLMRKQSMKI